MIESKQTFDGQDWLVGSSGCSLSASHCPQANSSFEPHIYWRFLADLLPP